MVSSNKPNVTDTITVTDTPTLTVSAPQINLSETITIADVPTINLRSNVSLADTTTVSDSILIAQANTVSVSDGLTLADIPTLVFSSANAIILGDTAVVVVVYEPSVSDGITVSDTAILNILTAVSITDQITLSDAASVSFGSGIVSNESITVSDTATVSFQDSPTVADQVTISDTISVELQSYLSVIDTITVSDIAIPDVSLPVAGSDSVGISDTTAISFGSQISVDELITISDIAILLIPILDINLSDAITVADTLQLNLLSPGSITVVDQITISDTAFANIQVGASATDTVTFSDSAILSIQIASIILSDSVAIELVYAVAITDTITVSDVSIAFVPILTLSAQDIITLEDDPTIQNSLLVFTVTDTITLSDPISMAGPFRPGIFISDSVTISLPAVDAALVVATDIITVSDSVSVLIPTLILNIADTVTISDTVADSIPTLLFTVTDGIALSDTTTIAFNTLLSVSDAITLSDTAGIAITSAVLSVADQVTISDTAVVFIPTLTLAASDVVTVSDTDSPLIPILTLAVTDTIGLSDQAVVGALFHVQIDETITVSDTAITVIVLEPLGMTVTEQILLVDESGAEIPGYPPPPPDPVPQSSTYGFLTFGEFKQLLRQRLYVTSGQFFNDDDDEELTIYANEALRSFNALANFYRDEFVFDTLTNVTWYDLTSVENTLRPFTVTDKEILNTIQCHFLEPQTENYPLTWDGSKQFSISDLLNAIQQTRDQLLSESGCTITQLLIPAVITVRTPVGENVISLRRVCWLPVGGFGFTPNCLLPGDIWAQQSFEAGFTQAEQGYPQTYRRSTNPPINFDVDIVPAVPGTYDILTINAGSTLSTEAPTILPIPNDWMWVAKWGAIYQLLNRESVAKDPLRAKYAAIRYKEAVAAMLTAPALLAARINDVPVMIDSITNGDFYDANWQGRTAGMPSAVYYSGLNMIGLAAQPDANGPYSVTASVVRNMPLPPTDSDFIQIGRDDVGPVLDEAQHIAMFKVGGEEFATTIALHQNFMRHCALYNSKLSAQSLFREFIDLRSQEDERARPEFQGPNPGTVK